jgi:hypothetical protein
MSHVGSMPARFHVITQCTGSATTGERKANLKWVARRCAVCEIGLVRITRRRVVRIQPRYLKGTPRGAFFA